MNRPATSTSVKIYLWSLRGIDQVSNPPHRLLTRLVTLWQALWLGWLDSQQLNQITWSYYMGKSGFEDEEFNIHQGLWPWEEEAIHKHFRNENRVLVAGAGGGREVIALARLGYAVTAFDFSSSLTSACRLNLEKAGLVARVLDAAPDRVPNGLDLYDALLIGRGFYHHIPGNRKRITFLKACRDHLKSRAPVILSDFFTRQGDSGFYLRVKGIANFLRRVRNSPELVELGDWLTNCFQHAFTRDEIEGELNAAGIDLESFAVSPFSIDSHLAHVYARTPSSN